MDTPDGPPVNPESQPRRLVLIVDDDPTQSRQIATYLTREGVSVLQEHNGFGAVSTMKQMQPAVVVMDVKMPGLDGIEAARLARKLEPRPKIILMSGFTDIVSEAAREDLGVIAVIEKPVSLKALSRAVHEALG